MRFRTAIRNSCIRTRDSPPLGRFCLCGALTERCHAVIPEPDRSIGNMPNPILPTRTGNTACYYVLYVAGLAAKHRSISNLHRYFPYCVYACFSTPFQSTPVISIIGCTSIRRILVRELHLHSLLLHLSTPMCTEAGMMHAL